MRETTHEQSREVPSDDSCHYSVRLSEREIEVVGRVERSLTRGDFGEAGDVVCESAGFLDVTGVCSDRLAHADRIELIINTVINMDRTETERTSSLPQLALAYSPPSIWRTS
jgi:hypothetical protein